MRGRSVVPAALMVAALMVAGPVHAGVARSWAVAMQATPPADNPGAAPSIADATLRQILRLSAGGERLRLVLDNQDSATALRIDRATVALVDAKGAIVPGSMRAVGFGGRRGVEIPAHAPMLSDWLAMPVKPLARIAVSFYVAPGQPLGAFHSFAAAKAQIAPGDQAEKAELEQAATVERRFVVAGVDVGAKAPMRTIITFGDSITDGVRATVDSDLRWPDQLASRLQKAGMAGVGVANVGISGNRMLQDGAGRGALARFDRDALTIPGASHVIVLEGVNDIGAAWREKRWEGFDTEALINAYRQMVVRAHDRGIRIVLATILPFKGAGYWSEWGEAQRQKVNGWIREQKLADGVVDLDAVMRDPADPLVMNPAYDCGDHLHPNDRGFAAMAAAVPLRLLGGTAKGR